MKTRGVSVISHAQAEPGHAVWSWLCHAWALRSQVKPGNEVVNGGGNQQPTLPFQLILPS